MNIILISQRIYKNHYEIQTSLSTEWTELFNNFNEVLIYPVQINTNIIDLLNNFNVIGIIITGGNDVYQETNDSFISYKNIESKIRDKFETKLINIAIDYRIPVMAICRGCQLIAYNNGFNVIVNDSHVNTHHKLQFINNSKYSKYLNEFLKTNPEVNSYHEQSIENNINNENINIICKSTDGFIEALEHKNHKILGIMWHPERNSSENYKKNFNFIADFFNLTIKKHKVFILCAGKGTRLRPLTNNIPKCMVKYKNVEIIDYILESLKINNLNDIVLIKGYQHNKLIKPNTKEIINHKFDSTNMVYSLFQAEQHMDGKTDIIISYSDIIYSPEIIKKLKENNEPISVIIDKDWYKLWSSRMEDPLSDAETLKINNNGYIIEIGKKPISYSQIQGQYIGLIKIRADMVSKILNFYKTSHLNENMYLTDFLTLISKNISPLKAIEINGGWSEFDTIDDLNFDLDVSWFNKNVINFSSKANNLNDLQKKNISAKISPLYHFNYHEWNINKNDICKNIQRLFHKSIIIRSSSLNEDTFKTSNAGQFLSLNNIDPQNNIELIDSINKVFESYGIIDNSDQILIQESLINIKCSGVFFTFDCLTNSHYYTLTYDESGSTDSVTAGTNNINQKCIYSVKNSKTIKNFYLNKLKKLSDELEVIFCNDKLDIEFAFVEEDNNIFLYLLQVRPLIVQNTVKIINYNSLLEFHNKIYKKCKKYFNNKHYDLYGEQTILSVMSDWNPAEIIGVKPRQLAISLYKEIITDFVAMSSRIECGYKDVTNHPLLITLINRPYIDLKVSFSSFIPFNLNEKLSNKLCNYYLTKLKNNPHLHDKVEFNICFTCNTINLHNKLKLLNEFDFTENEIDEINKELVYLTNNIISPKFKRIEKEYKRLQILEKQRINIINSDKFEIDKIFELTQILKKYGTIAFSNLARFAFISKSILLSFVEEKIFSNERYSQFMEDIHTISKDVSRDIYLYSKKNISKQDFLNKYGHLRPGTYDITSKRYDEDFDGYFSQEYINNLKSSNFKQTCKSFILSENEKTLINNSLYKSSFSNDINADNILYFIKSTIEAREYSKFIFSKTLSEILKLIKNLLEKYNISLEKGSNIDFKIFNEIHSELKLLPLKDLLISNIKYNENNYIINTKLNLPQLILNPDEIFEFKYINTKPTFITKKKVKNHSLTINESNYNYNNIENKIIIVSNADPGWEWLFSRNIGGLITCYGGMNSHMAIRCQELSLPAVIGCGPEKYETYKDNNNIIEIDCELEIIRTL